MVFEMIVETMIEMDLFQLFFPWLLVLAVTYGVLDKYDYFKEESVNAVVALAVSFIAIGGLYLFVPASLFSHFAAALAFTAFGIVGLLILMALGGADLEELDKDSPIAKLGMTIGIIAFIGVLYFQFESGILSFLGGLSAGPTFDEVIMPILTLIFLLLLVSSITGNGNDDE